MIVSSPDGNVTMREKICKKDVGPFGESSTCIDAANPKTARFFWNYF
jgi:hypothetical protein